MVSHYLMMSVSQSFWICGLESWLIFGICGFLQISYKSVSNTNKLINDQENAPSIDGVEGEGMSSGV